MDPAQLLTLAALALVDSTSVGTFLIPVWFMLAPGRLRAGRLVLFLSTVAVFYWVLGLALTAGLLTVTDDLGAWLQTTTGTRAQIAVGVLLLATGILMPTGRRSKDARGDEGGHAVGGDADGGGPRSTRVHRWRDRAMGVDGSDRGLRALVGLAIVAAGLEAASMIPYLAGIGIISGASLGGPQRALLLGCYCLVMIAPALLLLGARMAFSRQMQAPLRRVSRWLERTSGEMLAWALSIVGILVIQHARGSRLPDIFPG